MHQRRFTPFVRPTSAPAGTFDPTLDAQLRASQRGLGDLQADTGLGAIRSQDDLTRNLNQAGENYQSSLSQLLRNRQIENQNFDTGTATIGRNFGNLKNAQQERANAAGIFGTSGFDTQSQQARNTNQGLQQTALNTGHQRALEANQTQQDLLKRSFDRQTGGLNLQFERGQQDANNQLSRATREGGFFGQDVNAAELYQARGMGLLPSPPPGQVTRNGLSYQQLPGRQGAVLPSGRAISQSALVRTLRRRGWRPR